MSFWATMFLELWKRRQAVLQWHWDLENYEEEEEVRPQYAARVKTMRENPVTKKMEAYMPFYSQCVRLVTINGLLIFMFLIMLASMMSVMVYRMVVAVSFHQSESHLVKRNAR